MSKAHKPPVPPANRPPHGGKEAQRRSDEKSPASDRDINTEQQGQQGNTNINTHHQGYQQDR